MSRKYENCDKCEGCGTRDLEGGIGSCSMGSGCIACWDCVCPDCYCCKFLHCECESNSWSYNGDSSGSDDSEDSSEETDEDEDEDEDDE